MGLSRSICDLAKSSHHLQLWPSWKINSVLGVRKKLNDAWSLTLLFQFPHGVISEENTTQSEESRERNPFET